MVCRVYSEVAVASGFLSCSAAGFVSADGDDVARSRPRAAFKTLYSNDTTNITSCVSPYHRRGEPFTDDRLNDGHLVRDLEEALQRGQPSQNMSRFYWDNYRKYRLGPD